MKENLSHKKHWYHVSDQGIQFYFPKSTFISWGDIEKVQVLNDVAVKRPKLTFGLGLLLITSVLVLIPIQKFSFPVFGQQNDVRGTFVVLFVYLIMMGFGILSIRNSLLKKPVLKVYFKSGGYEIILLDQGIGTESAHDIISSLTKYLGASKVIFCKEAA
ncbi:hypothetical protein [Cecembia rubra]|uniref:Uncharacterized protein n=1 Tax=Cecembia rubra TaxID=1485585 RepID=A0A2P8EAL9_9BACT|nr:hypothetical protein [Cecembia rubra]PSL06516.1 hypothetical protein CLV48_102333 [Cecembia rubra]